MMFVDANIFLEIALKDKNWEKCKKFITELLEKKRIFYTTDFVVYSCLLVIYEKLKSSMKMRNFLVFINSIGISIIRPSLKEIHAATEYIEKYRLDFDDALVVSCMHENSIKQLVTYDKHFNKIKDIDVIKP